MRSKDTRPIVHVKLRDLGFVEPAKGYNPKGLSQYTMRARRGGGRAGPGMNHQEIAARGLAMAMIPKLRERLANMERVMEMRPEKRPEMQKRFGAYRDQLVKLLVKVGNEP